MKRLLLLLLLCTASAVAQAQTRIYFGNQRTANSVNDWTIAPAADAGWEDASQMVRGPMHIGTPLRGRHYGGVHRWVTLTPSSANQDLDMQYQIRLNAGITFTSGVTTVKMQGGFRQDGSSSDVTQRILGLRIIDDDGTTVNATLLSVANYGSSTETSASNIQAVNRTVADGDTVQATYTTVAGDWLVLEIGFQNDGATGSPSQATGAFDDGMGFNQISGAIATWSDCPVNETTTICVAWLELSNTITTPAADPYSMRFYFTASTAADVSPAVGAGHWNATDEVQFFEMTSTKGSSAMTNGQTLDLLAGGGNVEPDRVYVSNELPAGIVFTGGVTTVTGQLLVSEVASTDNVDGIASRLLVVDSAGTTERVQLYRGAAVAGNVEFAVSPTFLNMPLFTGSVIGPSYTTVSGDRLVLQIGYSVSPSTGGTTPQVISRFGENATDCAGPRVVTGGTDCAGWIEITHGLTPGPTGRNPIVIH